MVILRDLSILRHEMRLFTAFESEVCVMRDEYDFSNAVRNPYFKRLKKQITINIDAETIDYFKSLSEKTGIPYQTLINSYLGDCAKNKRELVVAWQ